MAGKKQRILVGLAGTVIALWTANSSLLVGGKGSHETKLIAHRGVHQIYVGNDRGNDACHAALLAPITHGFVENTIASMREAFRLGADVVEIDVHLSADDVFAVFHDWTLDCRTDGQGVTHEQSFDDLKTLDLAYRLDDGSGTFALRGTHVGAMPSLAKVLDAGMAGTFLINFKSRRTREGVALAERLKDPIWHRQIFGVYGGAPPVRTAVEKTPALRGFDRDGLKACLLRYVALGWSGYVPQTCRETMLLVPKDIAPWLWGYPHRFTRRMGAYGTDVILAGDYDGSGFSSGIDSAEDLAGVPERFDGYLWTNRVEVIGPLLGR